MGKSASGKDTLYRSLMRDQTLDLKKVVMYTTRPPRDREEDGREYYFTSEPMFRAMEKAGKVIESREYQTVYGAWYYYTADDGQIDLSANNYLVIGTPESFAALRAFYGRGRVVPVLIEVDDGERLLRAVQREQKQREPHYEEACRRFLADQADFSEEALRRAGIRRQDRFPNRNLKQCEEIVSRYIRQAISGDREKDVPEASAGASGAKSRAVRDRQPGRRAHRTGTEEKQTRRADAGVTGKRKPAASGGRGDSLHRQSGVRPHHAKADRAENTGMTGAGSGVRHRQPLHRAKAEQAGKTETVRSGEYRERGPKSTGRTHARVYADHRTT